MRLLYGKIKQSTNFFLSDIIPEYKYSTGWMEKFLVLGIFISTDLQIATAQISKLSLVHCNIFAIHVLGICM